MGPGVRTSSSPYQSLAKIWCNCTSELHKVQHVLFPTCINIHPQFIVHNFFKEMIIQIDIILFDYATTRDKKTGWFGASHVVFIELEDPPESTRGFPVTG